MYHAVYQQCAVDRIRKRVHRGGQCFRNRKGNTTSNLRRTNRFGRVGLGIARTSPKACDELPVVVKQELHPRRTPSPAPVPQIARSCRTRKGSPKPDPSPKVAGASSNLRARTASASCTRQIEQAALSPCDLQHTLAVNHGKRDYGRTDATRDRA